MSEIMEIMPQIQQLVEELNIESVHPTPLSKIQGMEHELGVDFPEEYKEFLQTYGYLTLWNEDIMGSGEKQEESSAVKTTLELRKDYTSTFPQNLIAIEADGFGNYVCIVCGGKDHGKIVFWQHDVSPDQVYPNNPNLDYYKTHPNAPRHDFWIHGYDFWTWLLKELQRIRKLKEEMEKEESEGD